VRLAELAYSIYVFFSNHFSLLTIHYSLFTPHSTLLTPHSSPSYNLRT
jgi:hypothetical protein